jgi:lactate permease
MQEWSTIKQFIMRTLPLWLTVLLLIVTRIEPIGLRSRLNDPEPNFSIQFGYLFKFELSASLVFRFSEFFNFDASKPGVEGLKWEYELLYIPFVLPFMAASAITIAVFRSSLRPGVSVFEPFLESFRRCV